MRGSGCGGRCWCSWLHSLLVLSSLLVPRRHADHEHALLLSVTPGSSPWPAHAGTNARAHRDRLESDCVLNCLSLPMVFSESRCPLFSGTCANECRPMT